MKSPEKYRIVKVLCVDDDEDDYLLIRQTFKQIEAATGNSYFVEQAGSLEIADRMMGLGSYDLFVVDCVLRASGREANGIDLIRQLRNQPAPPPIILISGQDRFTLESDALRWVAQGVMTFLQKKDLSPESLQRELATIGRRRLHMLLVEDCPEDRERILDDLKRSDRYRFKVDCADSAATGRALLAEHDYDALVVDFHLPDGSGDELIAEWLQQREDGPSLLLTGKLKIGLPEHIVRLISQRRVGFLAKDQLDAESLVAALEQSAGGRLR